MVSWDFVPDGFMAKNVTLRMPIQRAYGVEDYQISRGVKWLSSDAYNIEAKVDASVAERLRKVTREQRRIEQQPRLQHLLAERWKLELHHETKELPVYALVIAKGGLKMQEAKPGDSDANAIKSRGNVVRPGNMEFAWGLLRDRVVSIAYLARMLSRQQLGSPLEGPKICRKGAGSIVRRKPERCLVDRAASNLTRGFGTGPESGPSFWVLLASGYHRHSIYFKNFLVVV